MRKLLGMGMGKEEKEKEEKGEEGGGMGSFLQSRLGQAWKDTDEDDATKAIIEKQNTQLAKSLEDRRVRQEIENLMGAKQAVISIKKQQEEQAKAAYLKHNSDDDD